MEWFGLEGTFTGLAQRPCSEQRHLQPGQVSEPCLAWPSVFPGMGHRPPLGNLGQGFTTLTVKNSFLLSSRNLPTLSLKPLPLVLSLTALVPAPLQLSRSPSRHWQLL